MTNKRGNLNKDAGRGSPAKKTRKNLANAAPTPPLAGASSSVPKEAMEVAQGLRKTNHGVIFQLKLLMLFLIRGIRAGHAFRLGTEMEDIGGKFDDIIFQYEVDDGGKRQVNRYLQAKHKQNESTKITAGQLFNETEGDFSLLKYFSSYCGILSRGDDIQDCIICTNIGFNSDIQSKGIQLITVNTADEIFQFTGHPVARYKIQIDPGHAFWGKLRQINVAEPATKLKRNATDNEINSFFDKLVFVVNTPNEVTLGNLLTEEVGEYYELNEADFQSDFILRNMLDWFKLKKSEFLTSKQGQEILHQGEQKLTSLRMTSVSINYQTKLQEAIEFNAVAIDEMTEMLKTLLDSPNKIERIRTAFPKRTAVKVSAALKTLEKFKRDDSYLMSSSKGLKTTSASVKDAFKLGTCHQLLVVVCKDGHAEHDSYYENLIGDNQTRLANKKIIILCHDGVETRDDLKFTQLSDNCMEKLLDKVVSFQGTVQTVRDLTGNGNREEVIDDNSMEELLVGKKVVNIPLHDFVPAFDEELYIEREIILPFDDTFFDELVDETHCTKDELLGKLKVTVGNNIVWFVDDREKKELWNKIKKIFERRHQSNDSAWLVNRIPEKQLTPLEEWENRVVVVSDVAGTGKSTMLSNYYRKMRNEKPDNWIIKMDLVDHIGALRQFNPDEVDQQVEAIQFFIANIPNVGESPFAQSLLRHKLQTGDGIVVMLDGFDEIDIQCQEKCISLIKAIRLTNLNALYITTRPHVNGKLQDSLFQLAYTLRDFNQEDQINYLSGYWKKQLKVNADAEVRSIATSIVDRLSKSLKGNERSFIGIPLQCHIVADCFESQVYDIIQNGCDLEALLKDLDSNLNLDTLYERLFKKKREIYRQEKAKVQQVDNHILHNSLEDHMECLEIYLRDLAVKTIVSDQTHIDCLLGKSNESAATIEQQHKKREEGSVCFGLLTLNRKGEFQFLHRTYAEYLMANYLYGGFRLDDKLRNKLLDKKPVRQLISFQFLADEEYGGVQLFFDFMLIEILKGEKWRDTINRNENYEIPVHLKNFTNDCYDSSVQKPWRNCFSLAVRKEYMNIFTFLTCCMDVILEKSKVRKMVHAICKENREDFLLGFYYRRNCAGFLQFVDWYDDATAEKTDILYITKQFCNHLPHHTLQNTRLNQQEQKNIFRRLLDFMTKYEDTLKDVMEEVARARLYSVIQVPAMIANHPLAAMADHWQGMLKLFVRDDNFTFLLRPLLKLLSRTCDGQLLSDILRLAFETKDTMPQQSDMETVSNVLLDCCPSDGSTNQPLAPEVSRFILQMSPAVLHKVYSRYESATNMLDQQPGTDPYNLTQLHLNIFRGDEKAIESLLAMVNQNLTSSDPKKKEEAEKLIGCLTKRGEAPFTLIYLAAACNHEPILCNMLNCLKKGLSRDAFHAALNHSGKFLDNAYDDAMKYKKNEMYLSILKAVKKIIGNEYLLDLAKKSFIIQKKFDFTTVIEIQLLNHVANIFVEDDPQGYEHLNELIFFDNNITLIRYLDQSFIRGSISAIGIDKWINRLFDLIVGTFIWSIYDMLYNIVIVLNTNEEFSCFVKSITSTNDKRTSPSSIWAEIISRPNYGTNDCLPKLKQIFDCISKQLGERAVEELILSDDRKVIAWVAFYGHTSMFNTMLASLSSVNQEAVKKQLEDNGPQMVLEILSTKLALSKYTYNYSNQIKTLKYCLENGTGEQLSQLVDTITVVHEIGGKTISRWSNLFSDIGENRLNCESEFQELTELFLNKLDTNDLRKLLLHNVGEGTFIVYVAFLGGEEFAWSILDRFSLMTREEFNNHLAADSHVIIQSVFFPNRALISKMLDYNMNPLNFFLAYACTDHLSKFIALITVTHREQNTLRKNIEWRIACLRDKTSADKIDDFLQRVYKKLGQRPRRRSSSNERIFLY
ncbi:uncharacterized protein LOC123466383 [Daphnia magna]|uniref:uncharacterized protein LOC123466383 n=1 Tax=Daphnia magna TaxID=35525 RepID=UPI001E1BC984|nr:uncharacterized protein LOC123466383 [Daphnia magna]